MAYDGFSIDAAAELRRNPVDAFIKCIESPRTRVVRRPCRRAVYHTIEKVVTMIPNRNDISEERMGMMIIQQLRSPDSAQTAKKVILTAVETVLKMLKKVELATERRTPSASKALVMKVNVLFGIYDNHGERKEGNSARMWTGGSVDESTWRTGLWESLAFAFIDADGPYAKLSRMKADDATLDYAERAFMPYLSGVPNLLVPETQDKDEELSNI